MTSPPRWRRSRTAWWIAGAVLLAAALFAPVAGSGFCAVSPQSGASYCHIVSRSIVGIETNPWLWGGTTAVLGAVAWWLGRHPRRDRRER